MNRIANFLSSKGIEYSFYLLFFLVPLILTPFNYELFEYNKMMLTYALSVVIVGSWILKTILNKKINIVRTPLDLPLLLFLLSQIISTINSIDPHVSLFGYYSRFNGGLLSTISYIFLYYAFVANFPKEKIKKLMLVAFGSALLVSIYGILEHFGIDRDIWVQDVQDRVFSTLGQPNWLAAYLAVLIPLTVGFYLNHNYQAPNNKQLQNSKIKNSKHEHKVSDFGHWNFFGIWDLGFGILSVIFYITLIFTKSRSGFLGFWISFIIFLLILMLTSIKTPRTDAAAQIYGVYKKYIGIIIVILITITFFLGAPFSQIDKFTLPELLKQRPLAEISPKPIGTSIIDVGITESGTIRRIVWKGAVEVFKHYPLIGSGVETFAFSYYQFRPVEHNLTSEWDFLYNKAHNEYLNYAANTGIFGLGSYLLFILGFIWWNIRSIRYQVLGMRYSNNENIPNTQYLILNTALFSGWLSILVTNFFGFSVVIVQLFFFLIPAITFVLYNKIPIDAFTHSRIHAFNRFQSVSISLVLIVICYMLYVISRIWWADVLFARGYHAARSQEFVQSYKSLREAIIVNNREPFYYDEFSAPAAQLAVALKDNNQSTESAELVDEAIKTSSQAILISPKNVNFWKTRTRVFYTLSGIDEKYLNDAQDSLKMSKALSPTDPKITYNLAIIYQTIGKTDEAFRLLDETINLKPDYRDAYFAKAILYEQDKKIDSAREALSFILEKINPNDEEARQKLEELK